MGKLIQSQGRCALLGATWWLGVSVAQCAYAEAFDLLTHVSSTSTSDVWRIDRPNVKQHATVYNGIPLVAGDVLTLNAGGCVQTGGTGKTWKRYLDPSGPNTRELYHGLVDITGVTGGPKRIASWLQRPLSVPTGISGARFSLGYEDDDYGDNGYWGHDDGTDSQCKDVGPAWVTVSIDHTSSAPKPAMFPLDLVWNEVDDNNLPLNPHLAYQADSALVVPPECNGEPFHPQCTSQGPSLDTYKELCLLGGGSVYGHVNWGPATYEGLAYWNSHSLESQDDDYNIDLWRPDHAGMTPLQDEPGLHSEFSSDETIDNFHTSWWEGLHSAVDDDDSRSIDQPTGTPRRKLVRGESAAAPLVDRRFAIVTGLYGMDCAHSCGGELHPVWAFAIRTEQSPDEETWAIFVRNWGNEGYCAKLDHYLDGQTYTFRLPRPGAIDVQSLSDTRFLTNNSATSVSLIPVPGAGATLTFQLPKPEDHARINGLLHIRWTGGSPAVFSLTPTPLDQRKLSERESLNAEALVAQSFIAGDNRKISELVRAQVPKSTPDARATQWATLHTIPQRRTVAVTNGRALLKRARASSSVDLTRRNSAVLAATKATLQTKVLDSKFIAKRIAYVSQLPVTISIPANKLWVRTGIILHRGQNFQITATGHWSNAGAPTLGPDGFRGYKYAGTIVANADLSSLVARVGSAVFPIGAQFRGESPAEGELELSINDTPGTFDDNQGNMKITVLRH